MWQDAVFTLGGFLLAASLLPAVWRRQPPPLATSLLTGIILTAYVPAFVTLGLMPSAVSVGTAAALWGTLAVMEWRRQR